MCIPTIDVDVTRNMKVKNELLWNSHILLGRTPAAAWYLLLKLSIELILFVCNYGQYYVERTVRTEYTLCVSYTNIPTLRTVKQ